MKKKGKTSKKSRKKGAREDVQSSTSLPPAVDGPLRCFLRVVISKVKWTSTKLPDATYVRLRWWGETSNGTLFRPVDGKNQGKTESQTTARFPIRCGPKQFATYLSDMGSVSLEVLKNSSMVLVGRAQINEVSVLTPHNPITGLYPVFSVKDSLKIAEIQIAMMFEPLIASYDSSSSVPTTEASGLAPSQATDRGSVRSKASYRSSSDHDSSRSSHRRKKSFPASSSAEDPFTSATSKVHSDAVSRDVEDSDFSFLTNPQQRGTEPVRVPLSTLPTTTNTNTQPPSQQSYPHQERLGPDLISALLNRGSRLRDAMIKEEIGHHPAKARPQGTHWSQGVGNAESGVMPGRGLVRKRSSGDLFREILEGGSDDIPVRDTDPAIALGNQDDDDVEGDADKRAVELLVGDVLGARDLRNLKAFQSGVSPAASLSSQSEPALSDEEDPLHDDSILEELFYRGLPNSSDESLGDLLDSDSSAESDAEQKDKRKKDGATRMRSTLTTSKMRNGKPRPEIDDLDSIGYLDTGRTDDTSPRSTRRMDHSEEEEDSTGRSLNESRTSGASSLTSPRGFSQRPQETDLASGLSVQRLTLLGRVHVARVTIDKLTLQAAPISRIPVRVAKGADQRGARGTQGKPPRPGTQKKITYFVEYNFPINEAAKSRKGASSGAMATELMRVVSKKISSSGKEVTFGHRSVFPIQFDGQAVDRWWKQLLVFKVYSKTAGDKHPTILGVASTPLRSVLHSPDLVLVSDLTVKDKTSPRNHDDDDHKGPIVGSISMSMELASDSKDFPSDLAKTRVAEMQGTQVIPLPSSDPRVQRGNAMGQTSSSSPINVMEQTSSSLPRNGKGQTLSSLHSKPAGVDANDIEAPRTSHEAAFSNATQAQGSLIQPNQAQSTSNGQANDYEALTLHSLLYIKDGHLMEPSSGGAVPRPHPYPTVTHHHTIGRDRVVHNAYLVGRMFWSDDAARSEVCWGTTQPDFDYAQVSPVLLTQSLLARMRNNFTVIEVWDKKTSAQHDQLLGIAKLSLHQLYMSYRDQRIAKTLLKSQYPVIAVDNEIPITDPFTGQRCGHLTILLALGSQQQVSTLQRLKSIRRDATQVPERPLHFAERANIESADAMDEQGGVAEHVFEVVVEGIQGLPQLEDSVWGEADCFIQYHFPHQQHQQQLQPQGATGNSEDGLDLRSHRTATTLCVPDPSFNDVCRHRFILPRGTPIQRELLTACAGVGGHAGGIPFEVWCRFYYPNVRDQVIAKASLPLAKLCAMVTMQRRGEPSVQTFSLPLRTHHHDDQRAESQETGTKLQDGGLLDVTVSYKQTVVRQKTPMTHEAESRLAAGSGGPHASLALTIHRACGLKSAASALARYDSSLQYPSQVGVNSYFKIQLSFMAKDEVRVTRTIARSFCPEFNHYLELPCPLLLPPGEGVDEEGGVASLAEALESADLILQLWHQVPGLRPGTDRPHHLEDALPRGGRGRGVMAHRVIADTGDVLLGTSTIPLIKLLANRTGIEGWFPISLPPMGWDVAPRDRYSDTHPDTHSDTHTDTTHPYPRLLDRVAGGVELSVKFGHPNDREKVINTGRKVGWSPDSLTLDDIEQIWDNGDQASDGSLSCGVTIDVDAGWFPVQSSLRPGQTQLDPHTKAYIRYKFYDKGAVSSKLCYLDHAEGGQLCADFRHSHVMHANQSQPFAWYLREEQLEIQLWLSYNSEPPKESTSRPRHRDKLIGCAYIDLSPLCHTRVKRNRVSGLFPLFKPGSADMGGACLRAHISMKLTAESKPTRTIQQDEEEADSVEDDREPHPTEDGRHVKDRQEEEEEREKEEERQKNQPVWMTIKVERAMHLGDVIDSSRLESHRPCSYVTFQSAVGPSPAATPTFPDSTHPQWEYTRDIAVSPQVLDNQSLIFKICHQVSSKQDSTCDRVLGFTSVDLGPLLAGIRSLDGWYNIMDFSGQTLGQIKIAITPKESLSPLRQAPTQRAFLGSPNTSHLFSRAPLPPPHHLVSPRPATQSASLPPRHPAERSLDHFQQHLEGVRQFHGQLQERLRSLHNMEEGITSEDQSPSSHEASSRDQQQPMPPPHPPSTFAERTPSTSYVMNNFRKNMQELDELHQHLKNKLSGGGATASSVSPAAPTSNHGASHHHGNIHHDTEQRLSNSNQRGHQTAQESQNAQRHPGFDERTLQEMESGHNHHHFQDFDEHRHRTTPDERRDTEGVHEFQRDVAREFSDELDTDRNNHTDERDEKEIFSGSASPHYRHGDMRHLEDRGEREQNSHDDDEEDEDGGRDDMVFVRPLNDVSSAAFSNGISNDVVSPPFSPDAGLLDEESVLPVNPNNRHITPKDFPRSFHQRDGDGDPLLAKGAVGFQAGVTDEHPSSFRRSEMDVGYCDNTSPRGTMMEGMERGEHQRFHEQDLDSLDRRHDRMARIHPKDGEVDFNLEGFLDQGSHLESNISGRSHHQASHPSHSRSGEHEKLGSGLPQHTEITSIPEDIPSGTSSRRGHPGDVRSSDALTAAQQSDSNSAHATHGSNEETTFDDEDGGSSLSGVRSGTNNGVRSGTNTGGSGGTGEVDDYVDDDRDGCRSGVEDDDDYVEDGIVLTLDAREAELQRQQLELAEAERAASEDQAAVRRKIPSSSASTVLPDFFLPPSDLEASMRALYNTVSAPPTTTTNHELTTRERAKFEAAQEMAQRLTSGSKRSQPSSKSTLPFAFKQPTADEAKRIAKIFSAKF